MRLDAMANNKEVQSGFRVYRNAAFSVSDGTQLQFDTADYDPDALYQLAGGNQYYFVAPVAGLWAFSAQYFMQGSPGALDTAYWVRFRKNTAQHTDGPPTYNRGVAVIRPKGDCYINLAAGDKVDAAVAVSVAISASAINVGTLYTWFGGHLVRAA